MIQPPLKQTIDLAKLREVVEQFLKWCETDDFNEDELNDYEYFIYEKVMTEFVGPKFWEYINNKLR